MTVRPIFVYFVFKHVVRILSFHTENEISCRPPRNCSSIVCFTCWRKIYHFTIHVPRQKEIFATLTIFTTIAIGGGVVVYWLDIMSVIRFVCEFVCPRYWSYADEITSIIVLKLVYNGLRFRGYPGEWWWKLSDLTYVFHAIKGDLDHRVCDLHMYALQFAMLRLMQAMS